MSWLIKPGRHETLPRRTRTVHRTLCDWSCFVWSSCVHMPHLRGQAAFQTLCDPIRLETLALKPPGFSACGRNTKVNASGQGSRRWLCPAPRASRDQPWVESHMRDDGPLEMVIGNQLYGLYHLEIYESLASLGGDVHLALVLYNSTIVSPPQHQKYCTRARQGEHGISHRGVSGLGCLHPFGRLFQQCEPPYQSFRFPANQVWRTFIHWFPKPKNMHIHCQLVVHPFDLGPLCPYHPALIPHGHTPLATLSTGQISL